ncbi:MAG: Era-like GTP-binding protein [Pseudanabaenaceae cyanobacterium bins.39]|nr:Era-like GTP-binding protein [Pseudanabaenaceae cyanobacterium bins.39]
MFFSAVKPSKKSLDWLETTQELLHQYQLRFQADLTEAELQTIQALANKLSQCTIAIAVFGKVSTGKTSLINALVGKRLGATGVLHGVTADIQSYRWQVPNGKVSLQLIDTPGLDEVAGAERSLMALTAAKQADLILFVFAGDLTRLEQEAIAQLQKYHKPILLVFNKTDLYTDRDRQDIYASLQSPTIRQLISPQEIIMTVSDPQPERVRHLSADGQTYQDIWEKPQPQIQDLQQKIIDILNSEGKALLSINALQTLIEIQSATTQRYLAKVPARNLTAGIFILEAIALLNTPWQWLGGCISGICNSILAIYLINKYPIQKPIIWLVIIFAIATISGINTSLSTNQNSHINTNYLIIIWIGISLSTFTYGILKDINQSQALGKFGAKNLMQTLLQSISETSILKRIF